MAIVPVRSVRAPSACAGSISGAETHERLSPWHRWSSLSLSQSLASAGVAAKVSRISEVMIVFFIWATGGNSAAVKNSSFWVIAAVGAMSTVLHQMSTSMFWQAYAPAVPRFVSQVTFSPQLPLGAAQHSYSNQRVRGGVCGNRLAQPLRAHVHQAKNEAGHHSHGP